MWGLAEYTVRHYRLGVPAQSAGCLDHSVFLVALGEPVKRGDYVAFRARDLPPFPHGALFVKQLAGVPGDRIDIGGGVVRVNEARMGELQLSPLLGGAPERFDRHEAVPLGALFVLGTKPESYDSRYWGYVGAGDVIGRAYPIW